VAQYIAALTTAQQRAGRADTRPRADRTLADELAALRDLARFLADQRPRPAGPPSRPPTGGAPCPAAGKPDTAADHPQVVSSAGPGPAAWCSPTRRGAARRPAPQLSPRTIAVAEQRHLFRRWTTDSAVHPHEALADLLALLHTTPSRELPNLTITDIDDAARTIRLGRRPHPDRSTQPPGTRCSAA
jgi:hypothetical protein